MKERLFSLGLLCLLALTGCDRLAERRAARAPATLSPGDATRALPHAGRERSYIVHIPPTYDPAQPMPVVLVFHGGGGNAENARMMTGFDAIADAEGFIVVYPNGTGRRRDRLLTWNGGPAWPPGQAGRKGGDVPTTELDASQVLWDFFAAHPQP